MFKGFWLIGKCPLAGNSIQIKVRAVATMEEEPKNWKLVLVIFKTAYYIRTKIPKEPNE